MSHFIYYYAECHYAECRYAEYRGALSITTFNIMTHIKMVGCSYAGSFMLAVVYSGSHKLALLSSVIMLNVVMLSVARPEVYNAYVPYVSLTSLHNSGSNNKLRKVGFKFTKAKILRSPTDFLKPICFTS